MPAAATAHRGATAGWRYRGADEGCGRPHGATGHPHQPISLVHAARAFWLDRPLGSRAVDVQITRICTITVTPSTTQLAEQNGGSCTACRLGELLTWVPAAADQGCDCAAGRFSSLPAGNCRDVRHRRWNLQLLHQQCTRPRARRSPPRPSSWPARTVSSAVRERRCLSWLASSGRYPQVTSHFQQALALCRENGAPVGQARALGNLGSGEWRQGRCP
jgi:hypothetical protein